MTAEPDSHLRESTSSEGIKNFSVFPWTPFCGLDLSRPLLPLHGFGNSCSHLLELGLLEPYTLPYSKTLLSISLSLEASGTDVPLEP